MNSISSSLHRRPAVGEVKAALELDCFQEASPDPEQPLPKLGSSPCARPPLPLQREKAQRSQMDVAENQISSRPLRGNLLCRVILMPGGKESSLLDGSAREAVRLVDRAQGEESGRPTSAEEVMLQPSNCTCEHRPLEVLHRRKVTGGRTNDLDAQLWETQTADQGDVCKWE